VPGLAGVLPLPVSVFLFFAGFGLPGLEAGAFGLALLTFFPNTDPAGGVSTGATTADGVGIGPGAVGVTAWAAETTMVKSLLDVPTEFLADKV
jgi:hypothetical protein